MGARLGRRRRRSTATAVSRWPVAAVAVGGAVAAAALEALVGRWGGGGGGHGESGCGDGLVGGSDGGGRFSKNGRNMQMQQQRTWVDAIMPMKPQHVRGRERTLHPPSLSQPVHHPSNLQPPS